MRNRIITITAASFLLVSSAWAGAYTPINTKTPKSLSSIQKTFRGNLGTNAAWNPSLGWGASNTSFDPCNMDFSAFFQGYFQNSIKDNLKNQIDTVRGVFSDATGMLTALTAGYLAPLLEDFTKNLNKDLTGTFAVKMKSCREMFNQGAENSSPTFPKVFGSGGFVDYSAEIPECSEIKDFITGGLFVSSTEKEKGAKMGKAEACAKKASALSSFRAELVNNISSVEEWDAADVDRKIKERKKYIYLQNVGINIAWARKDAGDSVFIESKSKVGVDGGDIAKDDGYIKGINGAYYETGIPKVKLSGTTYYTSSKTKGLEALSLLIDKIVSPDLGREDIVQLISSSISSQEPYFLFSKKSVAAGGGSLANFIVNEEALSLSDIRSLALLDVMDYWSSVTIGDTLVRNEVSKGKSGVTVTEINKSIGNAALENILKSNGKISKYTDLGDLINYHVGEITDRSSISKSPRDPSEYMLSELGDDYLDTYFTRVCLTPISMGDVSSADYEGLISNSSVAIGKVEASGISFWTKATADGAAGLELLVKNGSVMYNTMDDAIELGATDKDYFFPLLDSPKCMLAGAYLSQVDMYGPIGVSALLRRVSAALVESPLTANKLSEDLSKLYFADIDMYVKSSDGTPSLVGSDAVGKPNLNLYINGSSDLSGKLIYDHSYTSGYKPLSNKQLLDCSVGRVSSPCVEKYVPREPKANNTNATPLMGSE